jgi:hypothetical protein
MMAGVVPAALYGEHAWRHIKQLSLSTTDGVQDQPALEADSSVKTAFVDDHHLLLMIITYLSSS